MMSGCEKICAGIVLYNPNYSRLEENIKSIIHQVGKVYLQDNGSSNDIEIGGYENIVYLQNNKNRGIAWALNRLCEHAISDGYSWILTLDQDSVCPQKMIEVYRGYLEQADMLCPQIYDINAGKLQNSLGKVEYVNECITSGCLLNLESWRKVGGFDEKMFIDGVDFDFCYRMKKAGMRILRINDIVLQHEIGNITVKYFLGIKVIVKNHNAFRKYYIARNTIYCARKKSIGSVFKANLKIIKQICIVILFEKDRKNKLHSIVKGFIDGYRIVIPKKNSGGKLC